MSLNNNQPGMEKNYIIFLLLSLLIFLSYPSFIKLISPPQPAEQTESSIAGRQTESAQVENKTQTGSEAREIPQLSQAQPAESFFYENNFYKVRFSTRGGTVTSLVYKGGADNPPIETTEIFDTEENSDGIFGVNLSNDSADLSRLNFIPAGDPKTGNGMSFIFEKPGHYRITKTYSVSRFDPTLGLKVTVENLSQTQQHYPLEIDFAMVHQTKTSGRREMPHEYQAVAFSDKVNSANVKKIMKKGFSVEEKISWSGVIKKSFSLLINPEGKAIDFVAREKDGLIWGTMRTEPVSVGPGGIFKKQFFIYAGPQRYETLKSFDMGFENILSRGLLGSFKIAMLIALKFCYKFTHNYGWAIILVTLFIKLLTFPLTHMQFKSAEKMKVIAPKQKAIQEKYKDNPEKAQKEMMELYKRHKFNPMGGCLPMLVQFPVFIAFYQVLNEAIELQGAPFIFWIHDLSAPDHLFSLPFTLPLIGNAFNLLPLLMIGSMVWQQRLMPVTAGSPEQQKVMQFMPIIFGFILYPMPSGLVLYWFFNNLLSVGQQLYAKHSHKDHDPDKE